MYDEDCSLHTGVLSSHDDITLPHGPCWFSANWKHNSMNTQCTYHSKYDGLYCDRTTTIRRLVMHNYSPAYLHHHPLWILPYDDDIVNSLQTEEDKQAYLDTDANYSRVAWRRY